MFSANIIAAYIINWCHYHNTTITNLKLQKLLYFVQKEFYYIKKVRLIKEDFYAYQLGAVIPEIYTKYSIFASFNLPIQNLMIQNFYYFNCFVIINSILNNYGYKSTWELVELSQKEDSWKYNYKIFGSKALIPYECIIRF